MIIGITGHARHGKDSTADIIVSNFGYRKHALADVMKEACRVIFGWTDEYLYGAPVQTDGLSSSASSAVASFFTTA